MSTIKEISIFSPPSIKKTLTKTERILLFDRLEIESNIPNYHFESFNELEDIFLDETRIISNIPAIIIKNNIKFLIPLVKKKTSKEFHISVQLNTPIDTKDVNLQNELVAASNSQIDMVGVIFDNTNNIHSTNLPTFLEEASLKDKIISGIHGLYSWYYRPYYDNQIKRSRFFQDQTYLKAKYKSFIIYFKNKDDTIKSLNLINSYIEHINHFYNDSFLFMYKALEYPPFSKYTKYKPQIVKTLNKKKHIFKNQLLEMINNLYTNNLTDTTSNMVLLYDIVDGKLWSIYQFAKMLGINNLIVKKLIGNEKERQTNNKIKYESFNKEIDQKNIHHKKLFIARSLFYKYSLKELTLKELDVVNLTYQKDLVFASHVRKNTCEHLKLLERVMKSNSSGRNFDNKLWEELKKLIPYSNNKDSLKKTELLKCSLCDFLVLCPHHYDQFEYKNNNNLNNNFKQKESYDNDLRLMMLKKYADKTPIEDAFFCKICGEKIVKKYNEEHAVFVQGEKVHITYTIDKMSSKIWKEVRGIISNHIVFGVITDINALTTNITDIIQPYIEEEKKRLKNIKTNTSNIIQNTVYLYIGLYAYASLIRIMSHHPDDIQFKKKITEFKKKKIYKNVGTSGGGMSSPFDGGNDSTINGLNLKSKIDIRILQDLLKTGLSLFVSNKLSLIKSIPNISIDSIKPLFIKAFKVISNLYIRTTEFNTSLPPEYIANSVVYSYLYYINSKHDYKLKQSNIYKILGVELQDIIKLDSIIDKAIIPPIWELQLPDEDENFYNDHEYAKAYHTYAYASFIHFISYVKNKLYDIPVFNNDKHNTHGLEFKSLKEAEELFRNRLKKRCMLNTYLYYNNQYGKYKYKKIDLSKIFCPNGKKHKFDIHVYDFKITRLELSKTNIDEYMFDKNKNNEFRKMKRVDLKCSICNTFLSKTKDVDGENSITSVLNINDEIIGFYNLYMFKCPVKYTHVFDEKKCTQCGVTKLMIFKKDEAYYKKYRKRFYYELEQQTIIKKKNKISKNIIQTIEEQEQVNEWKINNTQILELSNIEKIPINVLNNIGLIEGNNYEKILTGDYNPSEDKYDAVDGDPIIGQIIYVESYINAILIDYEMLKNGTITQPSLESFAKKWEDVDFTKFPIIAPEYHKMRRQYLHTSINNKKMINFLLHSLSKSLVCIYKYFSTKTDNINKNNFLAAKGFIAYTMNKILASEKSVSDPGILRGKILVLDDQEDGGDAIENDFDDRDVDFDDTFDPFSLESTGINSNELDDNINTTDD
jgi:hypothetical protein